jgi:hypothetical protein
MADFDTRGILLGHLLCPSGTVGVGMFSVAPYPLPDGEPANIWHVGPIPAILRQRKVSCEHWAQSVRLIFGIFDSIYGCSCCVCYLCDCTEHRLWVNFHSTNIVTATSRRDAVAATVVTAGATVKDNLMGKTVASPFKKSHRVTANRSPLLHVIFWEI